MRKIKTLIVDDHPGFREGLRRVLAIEPDIELVGEASAGPEAIEKALTLRPEVVLMDIGLPGMSGLEATRLIKERLVDLRVIILTAQEAEEYREAAAAAGASDYVVKRFACGRLAASIRRAGQMSQIVDKCPDSEMINVPKE